MLRCARCPCPVYHSSRVCYNCIGCENTPPSVHTPCMNCSALICTDHASHTLAVTGLCVSCTHTLDMMLVDGVHPQRHSTHRAPVNIYIPSYICVRPQPPPIQFERVVHTRRWDHENCVICQDNFESNGPDFTRLGCGHTFHIECVTKWTDVNNTCPTCRTRIGNVP